MSRISIMAFYDAAQISRVFQELRTIVEHETLTITEGIVVIDRYQERVWPLYAKLGKLIYNGIMMGDNDLRTAFDKMLWALISQEFTVDEHGKVGWLNGSKWIDAAAAFEVLMKRS